jgi:predicted outer membrane repeat protein
MLTHSEPLIRRTILASLLAAAAVLGVASISSLGFAHGDSVVAPAAAQPGDLSPARLQTAPAPLGQSSPAATGITATLNSDGDEWVWPSLDPGPPPRPRVWPWSSDAVPWEQQTIRDQEAEGAGLAAMLAAEPPTAVAYRAAQDRIQAALRAFDAARNAGPAAVVSFGESASDEVRAIIAPAVAEAQIALAGPSLSEASAQSPPAPQVDYWVGIDGISCAYTTIQAAINAAPNGATVRVVGSRIFAERIDFNGRVLILEGGYNATCASLVPGSASRVDGAAPVPHSTVDVIGGSIVFLKNLTIALGSDYGAGLDVWGSSHATLSNTVVTDNHSVVQGGGMYVSGGSQVTLTYGSIVSNNSASYGGGAVVYGRLNVLDTWSDFTGNTAAFDGGGVYVSGGTLYLNGADMGDNAAAGAAGRGGAIYADSSVVTLTSGVYVGFSENCCNVAYDGAGIYANNSRIDSPGDNTVIMQNRAAHNGGGLYLTNGSLFSAAANTRLGYDVGASSGNTATLGAGMFVQTSTVEFAGRIINNVASSYGGGIYATASVVNLTGASVGGTGANQANKIGPTGWDGAGMYLNNGTRATLSNTVVSSNTLQNGASGWGGGLFVAGGSAVTLTNSLVERNAAPSADDGLGAGIFVANSQVMIDHSQVISNTAGAVGGGIWIVGASQLTVTNGSELSHNAATTGAGGAIAATNNGANKPAITIRDSTLKYNIAGMDGGAIYLNAGTLDFAGWWDVRFNHAGGSGGAIAVRGTGAAHLVVTSGGQPTYLVLNTADGNGGAIYLGNSGTLQLYATAGWPLNINGNWAANGGAAYADAGGMFDVWGNVLATANLATGNGGVFYLSGGSSLWLDDWSVVRPQLLVNLAVGSGGAIYASGSPRVDCDGTDFGYVSDGNEALTGSGGAIYLTGSSMTSDNCVFRHNSAAVNGGAIAAFASRFVLDANYLSPITLELAGSIDRLSVAGTAPQATICQPASGQCSSLHDNTAGTVLTTTGSGGAVYSHDSLFSVNQTYLHRNTAAFGGAIYQDGAAARGFIDNTLVYSNTSTQGYGAGIRVQAGALTVTHGTLANNTGGAGLSPGAASTYVYNTIIWGNSSPFVTLPAAASCNIDQGGVAGPASNPLFVSAGAGEDYRLMPNSPAIDACDNGLGVDISSRVRPFGARYDMGAYEIPVRQAYLPVVTRQ